MEKLSQFFEDCFTNYVGLFENRNKSEAEQKVYLDEIQKLKDTAEKTKLIENLTAISSVFTTCSGMVMSVSPIGSAVLLVAGVTLKVASINHEMITDAYEICANKIKDLLNE